ncbi:hypothetical protein C427_4053 [Paraglaciecola psychrophila 170]|uniref:Uncharacterized protein n=1 Tax=Paraglaciecola psychrophila 170 TaxID=1129794 RepID=K6ZZT4_9ALTE|nr:hypothetical protein C427_4053 [Paraglaciecola psychrophila 170]GAC35707.1 hypothetical protein GPSY_0057 [Paraglaciecola psychrophila 170]
MVFIAKDHIEFEMLLRQENINISPTFSILSYLSLKEDLLQLLSLLLKYLYQ